MNKEMPVSVSAREIGEANPLLIYVTNTTPYFLSHRLQLARGAAHRGYTIALAGSDVLDHLEVLAQEGIAPVHIPGVGRGVSPLGDLRGSWGLARAIKNLRPAAVHASGLKAMFICALAGLQVRLPRVVCIVTGLGFTYISTGLKARMIRLFTETILRSLLHRKETRAVFQNGDDHSLFLRQGIARPETSVVIKGSGVDPSEYALRPEPEGAVTKVVFPARLLKSKGVEEFVEAARHVRGLGADARFILCGNIDPGNPDSLSKAELDAIIADGHVEVAGFQEDMPRVFAECNLVCLPSYREGVPKSLIEAASVGRAIVSTDVPGCREIVVHGVTGLLVPSRDVQALASALTTLIFDEQGRKRMGLAGRALVESEFSTEIVIAQTVKLYGGAKR